jgi:hypothetical protein
MTHGWVWVILQQKYGGCSGLLEILENIFFGGMRGFVGKSGVGHYIAALNFIR